MSSNYSTLRSMLDSLSSRDIAALYLGYRQMLDDLQALQLAGKRVPGGLSARIELASSYLQLLESQLAELAIDNPDKLRDVLDYLDLSSPTVRTTAQSLRRRTRDAPEHSSERGSLTA